MTDIKAVEVLEADFTAFSRVLAKVLGSEVESFQGLSGQFGLYDDVDALVKRLVATNAVVAERLERLRASEVEDSELWAVARRVDLLDSMLEQLNRLVTVADLRGAALTSGDLLQKLQGWIKTLRDWLGGIRRQLAAEAGE